jgi:hypothetical protein
VRQTVLGDIDEFELGVVALLGNVQHSPGELHMLY